jgi:hypothetical protein
MENNTKGLVAVAVGLVIGLALIAGSLYVSRMHDDALSVTGSAKQKIISDTVKWTGGFSRSVPQASLKAGYAQMKSDQAIVTTFLKDKGILDAQVTISAVMVEEPYKYSQSFVPLEYTLRQTVQVSSDEVEKITQIAKNLQPLIDQGIVFSTQSLEYYYSKLPDLRVALLGDAVKDAKARAEKIAQSNGQLVGSLTSAGVGVVQVMPVNSVEVSDYGAYDTSSVEKEVMVTVKTVFKLK